MALALVFVGGYVLLVGFASFIEKPVGQRFDAYQLNALIRSGALVVALGAFLAFDGFKLPTLLPLLAGLGIGLIAGTASVLYCVSLDHLPAWLVVSFANTYIIVTVLMGIIFLQEPLTLFRVAGLVLTIGGVVLLSYHPPGHTNAAKQGAGHGLLPYGLLVLYVLLVGVAAFLEKPALHGLDFLQLSALRAVTMAAVASLPLLVFRDPLPVRRGSSGGLLVGAAIATGGILYLVGLRQLPVSVAATVANAYVVVTVVLSVAFLHEAMDWRKGSGIALTLAGATLLVVG